MSCQLDELESAALEARQELAERRSTFPSICSNILMKTLKCDIKTSMTFVVDTGLKTYSTAEVKNYDYLSELGLFETKTVSYKELNNVEEHLKQVTQALNIISKNKQNKMLPGDRGFD